MQVPLQVTFRDIPHSIAVEQHIRDKALKLNQYSDQIISCQVVIEQTQKHQHTGKLYNIRMITTLPHKVELAVNHNENENLYVAIRNAFDSMIRKVEDAYSRMNGDVKQHKIPIHGEIVRLFDYDEFGFILGLDGNEYYFNADNVVFPKTFERLQVGTEVHFLPDIGDEGLHAHRVSAVKSDLAAR